MATAGAGGFSMPAVQSTEQITGGGVSRLEEAYRKGLITAEDVVNGLTIRAKERRTRMAEEDKKQKDLEETEQLRPFSFRAKQAEARAKATSSELGADIGETAAGTIRARGGVKTLGEAQAGDALVAAETESLKLDQALREAHKLKEDPIGLTKYYITKAAEWGEEVDPTANLQEARAKFRAGYERQKRSAMETEILKGKIDQAVAMGSKLPELERDLRKEFDNQEEVKTYNKVSPMMFAIEDVVNKEASGTPASGADDLKLIFSYMKLLDPGSVVRETEFANAQNAAGVPDVVRNVWNRALQGTRLNPNQRREFLDAARSAMRNYQVGYERQRRRFEAIATDSGLDPKNIVIAPSTSGASGAGAAPAEAGAAPRAGVPATNPGLAPGTVIVTLKDGRKVRARRTANGFVPVE